MRILVAIPYRNQCQSLRLIRSLIPAEQANNFLWFRQPATPGEEQMLGQNIFNFEPFPRARLINSLAYRAKLYHTAQNVFLERRVLKAATRLREIITHYQPNVIWGLGHLQQVLVLEETFRGIDIPLHLSVHDEPVAYMKQSSHWPHWQSRLVEEAWPRLLHRANSVDSVCEGMKRHLLERYGRDSHVLMPCPRLSLTETRPPVLDGVLRVGLSSSHGLVQNIQTLINGLDRYIRAEKLQYAELLWLDGLKNTLTLPPTVRLRVFGFLNEPEAIKELERCHFLYLPYWFDKDVEVEGKTSFPSKLSMYLPACRPILFHAPESGSPTLISRKYDLGLVWSNMDENHLPILIGSMLDQMERFVELREQYLRLIGEEFNISRNQRILWSLLEEAAGCSKAMPADAVAWD